MPNIQSKKKKNLPKNHGNIQHPIQYIENPPWELMKPTKKTVHEPWGTNNENYSKPSENNKKNWF